MLTSVTLPCGARFFFFFWGGVRLALFAAFTWTIQWLNMIKSSINAGFSKIIYKIIFEFWHGKPARLTPHLFKPWMPPFSLFLDTRTGCVFSQSQAKFKHWCPCITGTWWWGILSQWYLNWTSDWIPNVQAHTHTHIYIYILYIHHIFNHIASYPHNIYIYIYILLNKVIHQPENNCYHTASYGMILHIPILLTSHWFIDISNNTSWTSH